MCSQILFTNQTDAGLPFIFSIIGFERECGAQTKVKLVNQAINRIMCVHIVLIQIQAEVFFVIIGFIRKRHKLTAIEECNLC